MYINIRNTSGTEVVNNNIIEKLYNVLYGGDEPEYNELIVDNESNIQGSINVSILYKYKYDLLTSDFNRLFISYNDQYLYIKDPYVKQVLLDNNFGDDFGVYMSIAQSTTTIPNFGGTSSEYNTQIVSFDELQYFRNVTTLNNDIFRYIGSQFESIDIRNITNLNRTFYWSGIHHVKNAQNVTVVGGQCFENCTYLEELDVSNVKHIGLIGITGTQLTALHFGGYPDIILDKYSIRSNMQLVEITGLENMTTMPVHHAFSGNESLKRIDIGKVTGNIPENLFENNKSIEYINMPLASGTIGNGAFNECNNLETLNIDYENITSIGELAFNKCYLLTSFNLPICTSIYYGAFSNCTSLSSISIPSCTTFGREVFIGCTSLTSIDIRSANDFNYGLFNGCTNLTTVTGIENVLSTFVGHRMFYNCVSLTFPETLNINSPHIGYQAFYKCNLHKVKIGSNTKKLYNDSFSNCESLTEIEGLENITHIGGYIFSGCKNLEGTINLINLEGFVENSRIYNTVQGGSQALFLNCYKIKKVILGNIDNLNHDDFNLSRMPFTNCNSLHTVDITSINSFTFGHNQFFSGCSNMINLILRCTNVPTINLCGHLTSLSWSNIMSNENGKIYVPDSVINDYKSAENWSSIVDHIFPLSEYVPIVD